jgi:hypothetical protein
MEYLKKDITAGNLLGELDHPERFEVALSNVSHKINELWYDQAKRQVRGKIEILDGTPKGAIAKELLKAGIPLSISSRAAGSVNEDKTVSIQQIYTYDLVAKPGFENAQLSQVNESAQARINNWVQQLNESHAKFENKVSNIAPTLGYVNENVSIYDVEDKFPSPRIRPEAQALRTTNVKNKNEINPMNENQKPYEESFQQWSSFVKLEIGKLNERLDVIEDSIISGNGAGSSKDIKVLKGYANKLRQISENHLDWTSKIAKSVNKLGRYADNLAQKSNEHYDKTQKIEETVDYNAKVLNHTQDWVGRNAVVTNAIAETVDHNAKMQNDMNEWSREIAAGVNQLNEWGHEKAKAINGIHEWTSSIAKGLNETANWSEDMFGRAMSKTDAQKLVQYIELVSEGKKSPKLAKKINEAIRTHGITGKTVNENIKGLKTLDDVKSIGTGNSKVNTETSKASGVEFDGKTIMSKMRSMEFSKGKKPSELKVLDSENNVVKVGSAASVKGLSVLDSTKTIKTSTADGGGKVRGGQNMKLDVKPEGKLKESRFSKYSTIKTRQSKLDEKLAKIIDALEKEKAVVNESKQEFPFVSLLSESDQREFSGLAKSDKQKINEAIVKNPTTDARSIKNLWVSALAEGVKEEPMWLAAAPAKYKKLYEKADDRMKGSIEAMAEYRVLESQYQIDNFWETSPLTPRSGNLNEVFTPGDASKVDFKEDDLDRFVKSVGSVMERYND